MDELDQREQFKIKMSPKFKIVSSRNRSSDEMSLRNGSKKMEVFKEKRVQKFCIVMDKHGDSLHRIEKLFRKRFTVQTVM